jgi:LmbE family N-acetylglucosaminyl deacetylase
MATAVFFHAHPDDECILTGGTMAKLAADGHRVVLVTATRGDNGEVVPGVLADGEALADRRVVELQASAQVLGVSRVEILGYTDSGMIGTPENDAPDSFWQADVDRAARRLAAILGEEEASALVVYDDHGGYGHPDHIQVNRVGIAAGALAETPVVYEATVDRDRVIQMMRELPASEETPDLDTSTFGVPGALVTTRVDVADYAGIKRAAMACHRSQIPDDSFFMAMPVDRFRMAFGQEHFIRRHAAPGTVETAIDLGPGRPGH